jgi:Tol biopolymer transport system component
MDVATGTLRPVAATAANENPSFWSADGRVIFLREGGAREDRGTFAKSVDGNTEQLLIKFQGNPSAITNDGRTIVGFRIGDGNRDISFGPVDGSKPLVTFAQGPANETQPALSPDNRWLAYVSDEIGPSAPRAIFVQAFPGGGQKVQVSTGHGGVQPRWRRDGKELLFVDDEGWITSAPVLSAEPLRFGPLSRLFKTDIPFLAGLGTRATSDVTNDGQRFIVSEARESTAVPSIELITNWKQLLTARAVR